MRVLATVAALVGSVTAVVLHKQQKNPFDMTSGGDASCYVKGKAMAYRGLTDSTKSGRKCQNWTDQKPHEITDTSNPDNGLGNHSYCRAPADFGNGAPWCYTVDPALDKEECEIPECKADGPFARNWPQEADGVANQVSSKDCECAAQLYGSTTTTKDTSVAMIQKTCPCALKK